MREGQQWRCIHKRRKSTAHKVSHRKVSGSYKGSCLGERDMAGRKQERSRMKLKACHTGSWNEIQNESEVEVRSDGKETEQN